MTDNNDSNNGKRETLKSTNIKISQAFICRIKHKQTFIFTQSIFSFTAVTFYEMKKKKDKRKKRHRKTILRKYIQNFMKKYDNGRANERRKI